MTQQALQGRARRWARLAIVVVVAAVLVELSACVTLAPRNMAMFQFVIGAAEYSPFLALLDLAWCLVTLRLLRDYRYLRAAVVLSLFLGSANAVRPLKDFTQTAEAASAQLGIEESRPQYSLLTAIRGLPTNRDVIERDIHYAASDGSPLTMRLFTLPGNEARPTVVVIYGGAWRGGDASQCADVSRALASRGFTVAAIDYRHAPKFRYPAQLEDVRASINLLRDSAVAWNINDKRMAVLGRSSGGHLAELTAYSPGDIPLKAVVSIYAPYDLLEGFRNLPSPDPIGVRTVISSFLGGTPTDVPDRYHKASPASYIRAGLPPTLIIIAGRDNIVKPEFNRRAASELRLAHVPVVVVELPWAEHGFDMAPAGLGSQLVFPIIVGFLDRELRH